MVWVIADIGHHSIITMEILSITTITTDIMEIIPNIHNIHNIIIHVAAIITAVSFVS